MITVLEGLQHDRTEAVADLESMTNKATYFVQKRDEAAARLADLDLATATRSLALRLREAPPGSRQ